MMTGHYLCLNTVWTFFQNEAFLTYAHFSLMGSEYFFPSSLGKSTLIVELCGGNKEKMKQKSNGKRKAGEGSVQMSQ